MANKSLILGGIKMGILTTVKQWVENIWRVELDTPWVGGEEGTANIQAKQLAARTAYLKDFADEISEAKQGMPTLLSRMEAIGSSPKSLYKKEFVSHVPVAASTENIDLVTGSLIKIDGVQTEAGDLVFIKDQTNPIENGFWEAQTGAWNRYAGYADGETECFTQKLIDVHGGAENKGIIFIIETDAYVIGTTPIHFVETYISVKIQPGTAVFRDRNGEIDDVNKQFQIITSHGESREGRHLFDVLHIGSLPELALKLEERADGASKKPNFSGLLTGDYADGMSLISGSLNVPWNDTYKNNRIVLSGFNQYKGCGDTENKKNHFLFTFKDAPLTKRMNATNTNVGGYAATEMRTFLESDFKEAIIAALGGDFLYPVRRLHATDDTNWSWITDTVFLPTEYEVFGAPIWSHVGYGGGFQCQFPIFQDSCEYLVKRLNGSRQTYWLASMRAGSSADFVNVTNIGHSSYHNTAISERGCAPAFCVASRHE
jgi:hypothetical protein